MKNEVKSFPKGFLWGAATSSHQIEGGLINDWSEWEKSPRRLADLEARGLNPIEYQSGSAANSWDSFEADISCLKQINASVYRFSIEWSRVEPEEGKFDEEAIAKYRHFIKRLKEEGIEPFVTLWHWTNPLWLRDKGSWENKQVIEYFRRYSAKMVQSFPEVTFWMTLNEPNIFVGKSYIEGTFPPQKKNLLLYLRVYRHLIKAHQVSYQAIKSYNKEAQVGLVTDNIFFDAKDTLSKFSAVAARWWWNRSFLNKVKHHLDFIGLNFYFRSLLKYGFPRPGENKRVSDMGWELYPWGIKPVIQELSRYHKPIYITENGLADEQDTHRAWYITEVVKSIQEAIAEGADVRGYMHWSLLDNFEWAFGFTKKFGLFFVNRKTWERTARPSAEVYAEIVKRNGV
jgi:beta-glucosidase